VPEISIRVIHVDTARGNVRIACEVYIVRAVEEIVYLKAELEIDSLRDVRVFVEVDIRLGTAWPFHSHSYRC